MSQSNTTATCTIRTYDPFFNSLNQSPCLIGAYIGGVCNAGAFTIAPLEEGKVYLGPTRDLANACRCSSVFYSLISACSACQDRQFLRWSEYQANCSTVYARVFNRPIPAGTRVPHWAYLDPSVDDTFNITEAMQVLKAPESTAPAQATGTSSPTNTPSSSGSSKAGPIAGGVVGGVVGLALIAALIFWWTRRRRTRTAPSSEVPYKSAPPSAPTPMSTAPLFPPRLYDPSDPSTYPSPESTSAGLTSSTHALNSNVTGSTYLHSNVTGGTYPGPTTTQGRYTGAPEV